MDRKEEAWVILQLIPEITRPRFYALRSAFGSPDGILGADASKLARIPTLDATAVSKIVQYRDHVDLESEYRLIEENSVELLTLDSPDYPKALLSSAMPPPLLYLKGELKECDKYALALVGARECTSYGRMVTREFAACFAKSGITVLSGLARGIDSVAHEETLRCGGRTVAVLGHGLARYVSAAAARLAGEIAQNGALISEFSMATSAYPFNFPQRNWTLAVLSLGVIVVEASLTSGALITAGHALRENRAVYAVPGDIFRKTSQGANALLQQGAHAVQSGDDVLLDLQDQLRDMLTKEKKESGQTESSPAMNRPRLSEDEELILNLIAKEPVQFEELGYKLKEKGQTVGSLATILLQLEMKRLIRQLPGKRFVSTNV
ncbi:MAG: DNA-processing protein DprA [bacterium]